MARTIGKLTALGVARAKKPGHYGDGGGLYLLIGPTGAKSWTFRFRERGRLREMGLGPLHTINLVHARERARQCREQRLDGVDPIAVRRAVRQRAQLDAAKAMTFRQCAEAYIAAQRAGWRNPRHAAQWSTTLASYAYPVIGELPVAAADLTLIMRVLEPIWTKKPETASRLRGRIESVLDWATTRGYRVGENPARWKGHLENLLPKTSKVRRTRHHAALPYAELPGFMAELRQQQGVAARALEFTILTAARTGEAIGARWAEIDLERRLWVIPAERMKKADREHRVPLADRAVVILDEMAAIRQGAFVFPDASGERSLNIGTTFLRLLRRMGRGDVTAHGFRSAFSDWVTECTNFPSEARELALAHTIANQVEAAYRRGDLFQKRRQLAEAWARFATVAPSSSNVVRVAAAR
jgi:integrase